MKEIVEAILFSSSEALTPAKIAKLSGLRVEEVIQHLEELINEYENRDSALEIIKLGEKYLMRVKPRYAGYIRNLTERDLEKGVLRTLAIIALKQPIKLSDLARIRGNRCYQHVKKLKELEFINVKKEGRSTILTTTKNFAKYFGLKISNPNEIKRILKEYVRDEIKLKELK